MRLNLGCGELPLAGFVNVDAHAPAADIRSDVRGLDFRDVEQVVSYHLLEHIPYRDVPPLLTRIRSWMRPGAELTVEVPDMALINADLLPEAWLVYTYGAQSHPGEFHLGGFTAHTLELALREAGFADVRVEAFLSPHPWRKNMPCIEATGRA